MEGRFFHVCNKSSKVIFRDDADYVCGINRLAIYINRYDTEVLAYCFMSTHFHFVIKSDCPEKFIWRYIQAYTQCFNNKYKRKGSLISNLTIRELDGFNEVMCAVNYVLKNPIHHGVADVALGYPYSSVDVYYKFTGESSHGAKELELVGDREWCRDVVGRSARLLFGGVKVPDTAIIVGRNRILPESFVSIGLVKRMYKSAREFLYYMNKSLAEEYELFGINPDLVLQRQNVYRALGKLTDMDVCRVIDNALSPRTYTHMTDRDREDLWKRLSRRGVKQGQFERCTRLC